MNIGIIGLGLIGGSFGRAIKAKTAHKVYGSDICPQAIEKAELLNAIDERLNKSEDFAKLDVLVYAVTPRAFTGKKSDGSNDACGAKDGFDYSAGRIVPELKDGAIVLDVGGTKAYVAEEMASLAKKHPKIEFVAAHPMAGKEFSGISYSSSSLFEHASVLLVPISAEIETLELLKDFFTGIGFEYIRFTNAKEHDRIIAYTSQLPHVLSSCYIGSPTAEHHHGFSAGSFRDLSRVAKMSAPMWAELFIQNRDNLIYEIDGMLQRTSEIRELIFNGDEEGLRELLNKNSVKKEEIDRIDRAWKKKNKE
ncbi:MAG: prephenate dehydrogenase [Clostridiales bacterium]|jgi:prephenate dehydrogenase|nr:prephenate dehydrogenase [Clostridiales bacterium]